MESVPLSVCTKYKKNILVTVSIKYEMSVRETRHNWRKSHENVLDPVTILRSVSLGLAFFSDSQVCKKQANDDNN